MKLTNVNLEMRLRWRAHRKGWMASPTAAFCGVPFGPDKRDLFAEVMSDIAKRHEERCPICDEETDEGEERE